MRDAAEDRGEEPELRCPLCRREPTAEEELAARAGDRACVQMRDYEARAAAEQQEQARWDARPPAPIRQPGVDLPQIALGVRRPDSGWEAVDVLSPLECFISPCSHVEDVPVDVRPLWARAHVDVFTYIRDARASGDQVSLERGLKWYLLLPDLFLRWPRRGTQSHGRRRSSAPASGITGRFTAWLEGRRTHCFDLLMADRSRARQRLATRRARAEQERAARVRRACELVRDGQMSRAMSILHSLGIAHISDGVLAQLGAKHPSRQGGHTVPATLPADGGTQLPDLEPVELTETFRQLPSRAGCFRDGLRNEHLRALVGTFPDAEADQVMPMYD